MNDTKSSPWNTYVQRESIAEFHQLYPFAQDTAIFTVFLTAFGDKLHADSFHLLRTDLFGRIHSVSRAAQFVVERAKPIQMDTVAVLHKEWHDFRQRTDYRMHIRGRNRTLPADGFSQILRIDCVFVDTCTGKPFVFPAYFGTTLFIKLTDFILKGE